MGILVGARGFLALFCLVSMVVQPCFGELLEHDWEVEYVHWAPDCRETIVMSINKKFPGPTLVGRAGDTLRITVKNKLHTESLVIHWHGMLQKGTPWADGTASISQCAINPEETFVYEFKLDKPGTFFYHGHYGMQRAAGLYGSLIVLPPVGVTEPAPLDNYEKDIDTEEEFTLLLSDWWHKGVHEQEIDMSAKQFRFIGAPQTLLINGKGQFGCSLIPTQPQCKFGEKDMPKNGVLYRDQCGPKILKVEAGKTYRLRVASTTSMVSLNLKIANHKMKVVEADGNYIVPFDVDDLDIHSGESYSVLVTANQDSSKNYWISVGMRGRNPENTPQALALLEYVSSAGYPNDELPPVTFWWRDDKHGLDLAKKLFGKKEYTEKPPQVSTRTIKLLNTQVRVDNYLKWAINGVSLTLPPTPYLGSVKYDLNDYEVTSPLDSFLDSDIDSKLSAVNIYPKAHLSNAVFKIKPGEVIDVILQNANMLTGGKGEVHPWHLHGHDFWVLGYGEGKYTGSLEDHKKDINLENPPLKNTVAVFPGGWTALRFKVNNPGVWAFHCHIEPHLHMGMGVIFVEDEEGIKKLDVPNEAVACGKTATHLMKLGKPHHLKTTPVADATPPVAAATAPVADATAPVAAATPPIAVATPPVADATAPVPDATP